MIVTRIPQFGIRSLAIGILLFSALTLRASAADGVASSDRVAPSGTDGPYTDRARQILETSGVKGGLIVHVGCGDGRLTAALRAKDAYLVRGLDTDAERVASARGHIRSLGMYGPVSIDTFDGRRLPYLDNLVNLIVVSDAYGQAPTKEIARVLAPGGVALMEDGADLVRMQEKPWPAEIDEWTHYLHGPDNNAVAQDTTVGPPRHLQWVGGPRWSRHHEHLSSMNAMVSAGGRLFYIMDEGSRASIQLPPKWKLIARDAFNGTILWKRDLPRWYVHTYPLKSGPAHLPRRLVAVKQRVYVPMGIDGPLTALDAATGETVHTFAGSKATEEVILDDGVLFMLVNSGEIDSEKLTWDLPICWWMNHRSINERAWNRQQREIVAVDAATAETLWKAPHTVAPVTMAVAGECLAFYDGAKVVCLDRKTGRKRWESEPVGKKDSPIPTQFAPTLVIQDGVVLFAGGDRKLNALDIETGEQLWTNRHHKAGHMSAEDVLVVGGLAWTGGLADRAKNNVWTGYDLRTGEVKKEFPPDIKSYWFHHRCHRSKATVNFLIPSRTGIEFVDWRRETWQRNHWVRGACVYGIMPANGLVYAPPHPCACYMETKLNGLNALAPARQVNPEVAEDQRLEKGPAFSQISNLKTQISNPQDWPTYRGDNRRSGSAGTSVAANVQPAWQADIGGRLSAVTIAGGKCFVASIDEHTLYALDATTGQEIWTLTTGSRIDSPPTILGGCAVFGCADGYVYCVRASDGALAWRYLAAPGREQHVAFGQIESVWPVHGSVLVHEGIAHCVAGRSAFLDGGMRLCRIDVATGRLIGETTIDHRVPDSDDNLQTVMNGLNLPTGLPDVLSCDGKHVYMRSQAFDLAGRRVSVKSAKDPSLQIGDLADLFCGTGFLDGSWFHRSYWLYGQTLTSGCNYWFRAGKHAPAGRIMVFDEETIYGYGRQPHLFVWTRHWSIACSRRRDRLPKRASDE